MAFTTIHEVDMGTLKRQFEPTIRGDGDAGTAWHELEPVVRQWAIDNLPAQPSDTYPLDRDYNSELKLYLMVQLGYATL